MKSGSFSHPRQRPVTAVLKILQCIALVLALLAISFGFAAGQSFDVAQSRTNSSEPEKLEPVVKESSTAKQPSEDKAEVESVTMSISLEEGGVIDLKTAPRNVKIETWEGDEVLVIVEKVSFANNKGKQAKTIQPLNIQVTRKGKDVQIETMGGADWNRSEMDVSFRIKVPEKQHINYGHSPKNEILSKLTSVMWRVVHKEVFNWLF